MELHKTYYRMFRVMAKVGEKEESRLIREEDGKEGESKRSVRVNMLLGSLSFQALHLVTALPSY